MSGRGRRALRSVALAAGSFAAMEPVAYAAHRWLMHGPAWGWHASHHGPRAGTFERNDRFPAVFAVGTFSAMVAGAVRPRWRWLLPVGAGVMAYGASYALVHDVHAHHRVPALRLDSARLDRLARAHRAHHVAGGEPFGMLVPIPPRSPATPRTHRQGSGVAAR